MLPRSRSTTKSGTTYPVARAVHDVPFVQNLGGLVQHRGAPGHFTKVQGQFVHKTFAPVCLTKCLEVFDKVFDTVFDKVFDRVPRENMSISFCVL